MRSPAIVLFLVNIMSFQRKNKNGTAELYQDGKRITPLFYHLARTPIDHACPQKCIPQFHGVGIDVVGITYSLDEDWTEKGYDGESLLATVKQVKKINPNAKLLLRMYLCAPYWWMRKYPEELIK